jgi:unsaturated chondroitin disaccharide hydrolase
MSDLWNDGIERMMARVRDTIERVPAGFPHWGDPETGRWTVTTDGDWTGGYWIAMLWIAYGDTHHESFRQRAEALTGHLRARIDLASVFKAVPFYYGGSIGNILSNDRAGGEIAIAAAENLVRLYNPKLKLMALGAEAEEGSHIGPAESSIDSLFATPFLQWAANETGNTRMGEIARNHGDRVIELHLRDDGTFIQSTSLDPESGAVLRHYTHKGYSDSSTWGRAQAWGVMLSAMSYIRAPGERRWLDAAERGADWWMAHVPADKVAFWDFDDPAIPNVERDTAATAAMSAGLLKLSAAVSDPAKRQKYRGFAEETVAALVQRYLTPTSGGDRRVPGILTEGCFNKRTDSRSQDAATKNELIFGSYYLFEALHMLAGRLDPKRI